MAPNDKEEQPQKGTEKDLFGGSNSNEEEAFALKKNISANCRDGNGDTQASKKRKLEEKENS